MLELLIVLAACFFASALTALVLGIVAVALFVVAIAVALPVAGVLLVFALPLFVVVLVLRAALRRRPRPAATIAA